MPRHRLTNFRGPAFFVDESEVVQICKLICVDYTANMQLQGQLRKEKDSNVPFYMPLDKLSLF